MRRVVTVSGSHDGVKIAAELAVSKRFAVVCRNQRFAGMAHQPSIVRKYFFGDGDKAVLPGFGFAMPYLISAAV